MSFHAHRVCILLTAGLITSLGLAATASAQTAKDKLDEAKNQQELLLLQATADLQVRQKEAEARKAIAEAEKAEYAAQLPATDTKALAGKVNTEKFGAAGLVKAFDLARELSREVCKVLRANHGATYAIHDATIAQGIATARLQEEAIDKIAADLVRQNAVLEPNLDPAMGEKTPKVGLLIGLAGVTTGLKAAADLAALLKQDVSFVSTSYGSGTRSLFISTLAESCPEQLAGLGSGYIGELDLARYRKLMDKVQLLITNRTAFANNIAKFSKQVEATKGDAKEPLAKLLAASNAVLKAADTFIESLKIGDSSDKSPLYNAARYLSYSDRIKASHILDFDLTLEGMTITRDSIFSGQRLSLSGVALLWYRVHRQDGTLLQAKTVRRISAPIGIDLKGDEAPADFWTQQ